MPSVQPISSGCRRIPIRVPHPARSTESGTREAAPVLHFLPPQNTRGKFLAFHSFDEAYVNRLRAGDFCTQEHFCSYFTTLFKIKLGSRRVPPETIEDVRQETFTRVLVALREDKVRQPDHLGAYVNTMCNHVLSEILRRVKYDAPYDEEAGQNIPAAGIDALGLLVSKENVNKVREILEKLPERDRRILHDVFIEERDKDEVCRDFGVTREHLRLLLHRAKKTFKAKYLKHTGDTPPNYASA